MTFPAKTDKVVHIFVPKTIIGQMMYITRIFAAHLTDMTVNFKTAFGFAVPCRTVNVSFICGISFFILPSI